MKSRVRFQMDDVIDRPGRQIVDDEHFVTAFEQRLGKMASDEARATRDQNFHQDLFLVAAYMARSKRPRLRWFLSNSPVVGRGL
jgi:hypothetical protein